MERQRFRETGVIELDELEKLGLLPPRERMMKGPVAILECPEPIPCNICTHFCPTKAIKKEHISAPLKIDWDKCIGCGICVAVCPGLAAFVVDISKPEADYVTLPYEFLPAPKAGDRVILLDRRGKAIGEGIIERVWEQNKTFVVTVRVPKGLGLEVRAIWIKR
ncbi:MAG: 4Fe-4S binding protein [Ignisphaera sp.]|nr:4Fe-4S binding protein [Ignisphaera sp.]